MKKIFLTAAAVLGVVFTYAQFTYDYLKAADGYFKKEDYFSAAQYYEKYLSTDDKTSGKEFDPYTITAKSTKSGAAVSSWQQAVYNLAESYRMLNYHVKAEPVYKKVLEFDNGQFPLSRYHYATTLRALEKFDAAEKEFNDFLASYTVNDKYKEAANREILNLRFIRSELNKKDIKLYTVNKVSLNTEGATYAPTWLTGNSMVFTSTMPDTTATKKVFTNKIYQAEFANGSLNNVQRLDLPQDKEIHQGVASVTPDGNMMFFTRWTTGKGDKKAAIYNSRKIATGWSTPILLNNDINAPGFNNQQPFVMPDGKHLLFSSDRPGGQGGYDIWYAELNSNGDPVNAVNLGIINTKYDEQAPYYHTPSKSLVFSSNGRVGMGGFDFFHTTGSFGNWSEPTNFGYPVNSVKDDLYFTSRGGAKNILENVFLSSDRQAACCLEMFALSKERPLKQVNGIVISCQTNSPLSGVTVNVIDPSSGASIKTITTGADGSYALTLEDFQALKISATLPGYHPATQTFGSPVNNELTSLSNSAICLSQIPVVGDVVVLENVYYEFNKAVILDESFASLDKLVALLNENPNMDIEISGHTDNIGSDTYNQKLSEARAKSVVDYLVNKGIDRSRLRAKGYGSKQPIAPNTNPDGSDNPEGRQKNRRTEFKVLKN